MNERPSDPPPHKKRVAASESDRSLLANVGLYQATRDAEFVQMKGGAAAAAPPQQSVDVRAKFGDPAPDSFYETCPVARLSDGTQIVIRTTAQPMDALKTKLVENIVSGLKKPVTLRDVRFCAAQGDPMPPLASEMANPDSSWFHNSGGGEYFKNVLCGHKAMAKTKVAAWAASAPTSSIPSQSTVLTGRRAIRHGTRLLVTPAHAAYYLFEPCTPKERCCVNGEGCKARLFFQPHAKSDPTESELTAARAREIGATQGVAAAFQWNPNAPRGGVVLKEFLDPRERAKFVRTGELPAVHGPCLMCIRYACMFDSFLTGLQALESCDPPHYNNVDCRGGYRSEATIQWTGRGTKTNGAVVHIRHFDTSEYNPVIFDEVMDSKCLSVMAPERAALLSASNQHPRGKGLGGWPKARGYLEDQSVHYFRLTRWLSPQAASRGSEPRVTYAPVLAGVPLPPGLRFLQQSSPLPPLPSASNNEHGGDVLLGAAAAAAAPNKKAAAAAAAAVKKSNRSKHWMIARTGNKWLDLPIAEPGGGSFVHLAKDCALRTGHDLAAVMVLLGPFSAACAAVKWATGGGGGGSAATATHTTNEGQAVSKLVREPRIWSRYRMPQPLWAYSVLVTVMAREWLVEEMKRAAATGVNTMVKHNIIKRTKLKELANQRAGTQSSGGGGGGGGATVNFPQLNKTTSQIELETRVATLNARGRSAMDALIRDNGSNSSNGSAAAAAAARSISRDWLDTHLKDVASLWVAQKPLVRWVFTAIAAHRPVDDITLVGPELAECLAQDDPRLAAASIAIALGEIDPDVIARHDSTHEAFHRQRQGRMGVGVSPVSPGPPVQGTQGTQGMVLPSTLTPRGAWMARQIIDTQLLPVEDVDVVRLCYPSHREAVLLWMGERGRYNTKTPMAPDTPIAAVLAELTGRNMQRFSFGTLTLADVMSDFWRSMRAISSAGHQLDVQLIQACGGPESFLPSWVITNDGDDNEEEADEGAVAVAATTAAAAMAVRVTIANALVVRANAQEAVHRAQAFAWTHADLAFAIRWRRQQRRDAVAVVTTDDELMEVVPGARLSRLELVYPHDGRGRTAEDAPPMSSLLTLCGFFEPSNPDASRSATHAIGKTMPRACQVREVDSVTVQTCLESRPFAHFITSSIDLTLRGAYPHSRVRPPFAACLTIKRMMAGIESDIFARSDALEARGDHVAHAAALAAIHKGISNYSSGSDAIGHALRAADALTAVARAAGHALSDLLTAPFRAMAQSIRKVLADAVAVELYRRVASRSTHPDIVALFLPRDTFENRSAAARAAGLIPELRDNTLVEALSAILAEAVVATRTDYLKFKSARGGEGDEAGDAVLDRLVTTVRQSTLVANGDGARPVCGRLVEARTATALALRESLLTVSEGGLCAAAAASGGSSTPTPAPAPTSHPPAGSGSGSGSGSVRTVTAITLEAQSAYNAVARRLHYKRSLSSSEMIGQQLLQMVAGKETMTVTTDEVMMRHHLKQAIIKGYAQADMSAAAGSGGGGGGPAFYEMAANEAVATIGSALGLGVPVLLAAALSDEIITSVSDVALTCLETLDRLAMRAIMDRSPIVKGIGELFATVEDDEKGGDENEGENEVNLAVLERHLTQRLKRPPWCMSSTLKELQIKTRIRATLNVNVPADRALTLLKYAITSVTALAADMRAMRTAVAARARSLGGAMRYEASMLRTDVSPFVTNNPTVLQYVVREATIDALSRNPALLGALCVRGPWFPGFMEFVCDVTDKLRRELVTSNGLVPTDAALLDIIQNAQRERWGDRVFRIHKQPGPARFAWLLSHVEGDLRALGVCVNAPEGGDGARADRRHLMWEYLVALYGAHDDLPWDQKRDMEILWRFGMRDNGLGVVARMHRAYDAFGGDDELARIIDDFTPAEFELASTYYFLLSRVVATKPQPLRVRSWTESAVAALCARHCVSDNDAVPSELATVFVCDSCHSVVSQIAPRSVKPTNVSSCYGVTEDSRGRLVCADRHNTEKKRALFMGEGAAAPSPIPPSPTHTHAPADGGEGEGAREGEEDSTDAVSTGRKTKRKLPALPIFLWADSCHQTKVRPLAGIGTVIEFKTKYGGRSEKASMSKFPLVMSPCCGQYMRYLAEDAAPEGGHECLACSIERKAPRTTPVQCASCAAVIPCGGGVGGLGGSAAKTTKTSMQSATAASLAALTGEKGSNLIYARRVDARLAIGASDNKALFQRHVDKLTAVVGGPRRFGTEDASTIADRRLRVGEGLPVSPVAISVLALDDYTTMSLLPVNLCNECATHTAVRDGDWPVLLSDVHRNAITRKSDAEKRALFFGNHQFSRPDPVSASAWVIGK